MASRGTINKNDASFHSGSVGLNLYVRNKITCNRICAAAATFNRLTVQGGDTCLQNLKVSGSATFVGDVDIGGSIDVTELLVDGNATITGDLNVEGNTTLQGDLTVAGDTTLQGDLTVEGNTSLDGDLYVAGDTTLIGNLFVSGDTILNNNLFVSGSTTLTELTVTGNTTLQGDTNIGGDLQVSGDTTLGGDLLVSGDLTVNGHTQLTTLEVSGDTTFSSDVVVTGGTLTTDDVCVSAGFTLFADSLAPKSGNTLTIGGAGDSLVVDRISTNFIEGQFGGPVTIATAVNVLGDLTVQGVICSTLPDSIVETNTIRSKANSTTLIVGTTGQPKVVCIATGNTLQVDDIQGKAANIVNFATQAGADSVRLDLGAAAGPVISSQLALPLRLTGGGNGISLEDTTVTQNVAPDANNTRDLGTITERWATVYAIDMNATGTSTLSTVDINGGTIDGTVIGGAVPVTLTAVTADINGGTIDGTVIGGTTPAAGTFTDLSATSATLTTADINGGTIDGTTIGSAVPAGATFTSVVATTADINGGTIDGTTIGGAVPAAGTFTNLSATSATLTTADINGGTIDGTVIGGAVPVTLTAVTADINGGTIDGTTIGGTTPAAGTFTDLSATSATLTTADINGGTIDATVIGQTTAAGATFTQVNVDNIRLDGNTIDVTNLNGNLILGATGTGDVLIGTSFSLLPQTDVGSDLGGQNQRWDYVYARRMIISAGADSSFIDVAANRNMIIGQRNGITNTNSNSFIVGRDCTINSTQTANAIIASERSHIGAGGACNTCAIIGGNGASITASTTNTVIIKCSGITVPYSTSLDNSFHVVTGATLTDGQAIFKGSIVPSITGTFDLGSASANWDTIYYNTAVTTSDARLKEDISPLEQGLETVVQLQPVSFRWKTKNVAKQPIDKKEYGLIAQEVEDIDPGLVRKPTDYPEPSDGSKLQEREMDIRGVNYNFVVPLLINAVKELKQVCDRQQEQIDSLLAQQ